MKFIKRLFIGIVSIIVLLLIVALFVPKKYTVSESINIKKPKQVVYDYVKLLKNQEQFSEWAKKDIASLSYKGIDGTVGATQSWNSTNKDVGEGLQTITAVTPDKIEVDLQFIRPMESKAKASQLLKMEADSSTTLTSEFYASDSWPMNLFGYFYVKSMIKETEIQNLKNVKAILEK